MHFHINRIKVTANIDGWVNTIVIEDRDVLKLRDIHLTRTEHKTIDLSFYVNVPTGVAKIELPVTLNCMNGTRLSMELPSKVIAMVNDKRHLVILTNPSFELIDLTPAIKSANIIPVFDVVA